MLGYRTFGFKVFGRGFSRVAEAAKARVRVADIRVAKGSGVSKIWDEALGV